MRTLTSAQQPGPAASAESVSDQATAASDQSDLTISGTAALRPAPAAAVDNAATAKPASELIFSVPAVIQREPVAGVDGEGEPPEPGDPSESAEPSEPADPPGKEVITVGKKIRDSVSYWKRIRSQDPSRGLPNAQDVSARHISPQHIMYIK